MIILTTARIAGHLARETVYPLKEKIRFGNKTPLPTYL